MNRLFLHRLRIGFAIFASTHICGCHLFKKKKSTRSPSVNTPTETPHLDGQIVNHLRINLSHQVVSARQEYVVLNSALADQCAFSENLSTELLNQLPFFSTGVVSSATFTPSEFKLQGQLAARGLTMSSSSLVPTQFLVGKIFKFDPKAESLSFTYKNSASNTEEQPIKFGKIPRMDEFSVNGESLTQSDSLDSKNNHRLKVSFEKNLTLSWAIINSSESDIILIRISSTAGRVVQCRYAAKAGAAVIGSENLKSFATTEVFLSVFLIHSEMVSAASMQWLLSSVDDRNIEVTKGN